MPSANFAFHGTLVATTVQTVTLNEARGQVTVINRSATGDIYFTVGDSGQTPPAPTVGGADCYIASVVSGEGSPTVPAGQQPVVVSLISSATPSFSVIGGLDRE